MRRNVWLPLATVVAVFAICLTPSILAGQSKAQLRQEVSTMTTKTVEAVEPPVAVVSPPLCANPVPERDYEYEVSVAVNYMRSPERVARYAGDFQQASLLIARGLDAGKFSPVTKRYDEQKSDRQPGYSGWGGISTLDNDYYAWVWWNHNGSIAYTRMGVQGFAVSAWGTHLQIEKLDEDAWAALDYTMTVNFGSNWRQL